MWWRDLVGVEVAAGFKELNLQGTLSCVVAKALREQR